MKSVTSRFLVTLIVNIIKAILGFAVGMLLAKGLGVEDYGRYSFLLATFISFLSILDLGSSAAFYTFISKAKQSPSFYIYYFIWVLIQVIFVCLIIYVVTPDTILNAIFLGESKYLIIMSFVAVFFQQRIWNMLAQIAESNRDTIKIQLLNLAVAIINIGSIYYLYSTSDLTIENSLIVIINQFVLALFIFFLRIFNFSKLFSEQGNAYSFKTLFEQYKKYCTPLIIYAWISFAYQFFDVWLLQYFGGASEQAYYAVGSKIAALSLIFTTALVRIFWKEISEANYKNDNSRVKYIYFRATRVLFTVSAVITSFVLPWSSELILTVLGDQYNGSILVLMIMLFYPIHQSLGQINGTMFYAIEKTKIYTQVGILGMVLSAVVTYFMVASESMVIPGLEMGAEGIAYKMVIMQWCTVNLGMYVMSKIQSWEFKIIYQFFIIGSLTLVGFSIYWCIQQLVFSQIYAIVLYTAIYMSVIMGMIFLFPALFLGMNKSELLKLVSMFLPKTIRHFRN